MAGFVTALLLLFLSGWVSGEEGIRGSIRGSLVNGTTGETVSGVTVVLQRYEGEQEREKRKATSDAQGKFRFEDLDRGRGTAYRLQVVYKGVEYYSPVLTFEGPQAEISSDMTVYETTDSDEKVSVVMHHILTDPKEGALWVREMMIIENRGDRVFVGSRKIGPDKRETLRISIPPQAQELKLIRGLMSCCIVETEDGFADTMDIKPGRKDVVFAYKVDYGRSSLSFSKKINLLTHSLNVFVPDRGIRATGENLEYVGLIGEPENRFLHFARANLAKGSQVLLTLKGLPWQRKFLRRAAPILGIALLALGLLYPVIRRRRKPSGDETERDERPKSRSSLNRERRNLLQAIAQLDDDLDSGHVSREEHERKRRLLKERVVQITETLQGAGKTGRQPGSS